MAWVKLDDQAPRNEKMLRAGPCACWLWVCGIAHSQSQLTDGFISNAALPLIGVLGTARTKRLAEMLVTARLFDRVEGGYQVHDYLDHNPSRAVVLAKRAEDLRRKHSTHSARNPTGIQLESERNPNGIQTSPRPPARAPTPASHPIPSDPNTKTDGRVRKQIRELPPMVEDPVVERAARLLERYAELFYEHRHGARYHNRMHIDLPKACELVQTWLDDARLEKMAVVVLTTDDAWIARTDRGFSVFAAKATWADDRIKAWELEHEVTA